MVGVAKVNESECGEGVRGELGRKGNAICFLSEGRLGGVVFLGGSRLPPKTTEMIWVTGREKGSA